MFATSGETAVLITGASKRIGREIALTLAQKTPVIIHYHHSKDEAEALAGELSKQQLSATTIKADLNNELEIKTLIEKASEQAGKAITGLINNASLFEEDNPLTVTKDLFEHHMNINLWAPLQLSQSLVKALPKGKQGHIINIIDQRVLSASTGFTSYSLSKSALLALTQNLAKELAPNVQVNAIAPGPVLQSIHQTQGEFESEVARLPLARNANANDIARAVLFLLENSAITGEMITLDGGQHLL